MTGGLEHPALPAAGEKRKRLPVSTGSIDELRKAVSKTSDSPHLRARRHTIIKLLEVTDARRGEIAGITVDAVREAAEMASPLLRVPTLKRRGPHIHSRYIPVSRADLSFLIQYVEVHRRAVIRKRLNGQKDHGFLLVSEKTGQALRTNTVTQEIRMIAHAANVTNSICPHMFRHRFITKLFVALIEHHEVTNPDQLRRIMIDGETIKRKVAEWTGHNNTDSLNNYIDLAFEEASGFSYSYSAALLAVIVDSFIGTIRSEMESIPSKDSLAWAERMASLTEAFRDDLASSGRRLVTAEDHTERR